MRDSRTPRLIPIVIVLLAVSVALQTLVGAQTSTATTFLARRGSTWHETI